ncbi:hypothetical protein LEP1GSC096_1593 [Leptospira interrogans serovar Hebdomadis str. R499]|nr:hypothetical protein LEP1GSC096_1593 [Leptospira interrogans serovar Hebdomadis str. R499]EMK23672.1 hypothetical protein LEP1GSC075_2226 [Leptospira interrogans str. Kito]
MRTSAFLQNQLLIFCSSSSKDLIPLNKINKLLISSAKIKFPDSRHQNFRIESLKFRNKFRLGDYYKIVFLFCNSSKKRRSHTKI